MILNINILCDLVLIASFKCFSSEGQNEPHMSIYYSWNQINHNCYKIIASLSFYTDIYQPFQTVKFIMPTPGNVFFKIVSLICYSDLYIRLTADN